MQSAAVSVPVNEFWKSVRFDHEFAAHARYPRKIFLRMPLDAGEISVPKAMLCASRDGEGLQGKDKVSDLSTLEAN